MRYFYFFFLIIAIGCQPESSRSDKDQNDGTTDAKKLSKPYVLKKNEGETLIDDIGRTLIIKASPETGLAHITMGTEHHPIGAGTLIHKHDHTEEILFVH